MPRATTAVVAVALAGVLAIVEGPGSAGRTHESGTVSLAATTTPTTPQAFPPLRGWFSYQDANFHPDGTYEIEAIATTSFQNFASLTDSAFRGMHPGEAVIWVTINYRPPIRAIRAATGSSFSLGRASIEHHACLFPGKPCLPGVRYSWVAHATLTSAHPYVSVDAYVPNRRPGSGIRAELQARIHQLLVPNLG